MITLLPWVWLEALGAEMPAAIMLQEGCARTTSPHPLAPHPHPLRAGWLCSAPPALPILDRAPRRMAVLSSRTLSSSSCPKTSGRSTRPSSSPHAPT
eukprot:5943857-Prymnesium_polylepis.1